MKVHLLDGTYELFRHYYGLPPGATPEDDPVRAVRGVVYSVLTLLEEGVTHLGVATDHVIESFRNDLWPGYKSSAGMPPVLLAQFPLLEEALEALGVVVWPMVDLEADDALAAAAKTAAADPEVEQVVIMTPDKDLAQCVIGTRVVQLDRRAGHPHRRGRRAAPSTACPRSRSPTGWPWWATRPTASPASRGGARRAPPPSSSTTPTWRTSPSTAGGGRPTCGAPTPCPPPSTPSATWPSSSATWPPCGPTPPSSTRSTTSGGPARPGTSSRLADRLRATRLVERVASSLRR